MILSELPAVVSMDALVPPRAVVVCATREMAAWASCPPTRSASRGFTHSAPRLMNCRREPLYSSIYFLVGREAVVGAREWSVWRFLQ